MTKTQKAHVDRMWEVIEKASIAMFVTHFSEGLRARPMEAHAEPEEEAIWFLTDRRGLKDDEVERCPEVCLTFTYPEEKVYLSLTGQASLCRDRAKARDLWNRKQEAWWDGPDDPNLLVMRVALQRAEMWDGPANSAIAAYEFAKARIFDQKPDLGENRKITLDML
jgi:general stress protein 26